MNVIPLEILLRLYVLLVEITFVHISMNFETQYGNISKGAGWTLTPDAILSLRPATPRRPDTWASQRIRSLGCARSRRGQRGGRLKQKVKLQQPIPVVVGRRSKDDNSEVNSRDRVKRTLRHIPVWCHPSVAVPPATSTVSTTPTLYVLNAAAITKPHAVEQLTVDLTGYAV